MCRRDPAVNFLPRDQSEPDWRKAEWIIFPTAVDAALHRLVSLDTTFRREFVQNSLPRTARLWIRAAKRVEVKINGVPVSLGPGRNWKDISNADVVDLLRTGQNVIEARVFNHTAPPALWLVLNTDQLTVASDQSWRASIAGSAWRGAVLASTPKTPGAGNPIAGGEQSFRALGKIWPIWIGFTLIAVVVLISGFRSRIAPYAISLLIATLTMIASGKVRTKLPVVDRNGLAVPRPRSEYSPQATPAMAISTEPGNEGAFKPGRTR